MIVVGLQSIVERMEHLFERVDKIVSSPPDYRHINPYIEGKFETTIHWHLVTDYRKRVNLLSSIPSFRTAPGCGGA